MQDFFVVKKLKFFYSIVSGTSLIEIPDYVIHKASSRTAHNRYNFAISPELKLPIVRPLGSSFFASCIEHWNLLPDSIKINSSADQFRKDLECFFWENIAERYEIEPD